MTRARDQRGAVAVLVAVLAAALFTTAALVVDLGLARDTRWRSQISADAAALAAGNVLYGNGTKPRFVAAVQAAQDYAAENYGTAPADWATCADPTALRYRPGGTSCISFQSSVSAALDSVKPDTVRVRIPVRDVPTGLGAVAGVTSIPVAAQAETSMRLDTRPGCALCVLGAGPHDLQNGDIAVDGGDIRFNGSVTMNSSNGSVTTSGKTYVQGTAASGTYSPAPLTGQAPTQDPLAFMPMPDWTTVQPRSNPCTDGPGRYESYRFSSACTLAPGLYVVAGSASVWDTSGQGAVTGNGVTLFFTCGTKYAPAPCSPTVVDGAALDMAGASTFSLTAPSSGDLKGLAVVYDRFDDRVLRVVGTSGPSIQGTVYALSGTLQMNGNACISSLRSMIVVKTIAMNGNPSCLTSDYALSSNVDLPPDSLRLSQ